MAARLVGQGKTAVVVGGLGRMGRWFTRFLADQGYAAGALDLIPPATNTPGPATRCRPPISSSARSAGGRGALYESWAARPPRGVIVDIASIKTPLIGPIRRLQAAGARVASIHPMFGPSVVLLRDCDVVICDTGDTAAGGNRHALFRQRPHDCSTCRSTNTIG